MPTKTPAKRATKPAARKAKTQPKPRSVQGAGFSDAHKRALAEGREQGRVIRRYLEAKNTPGRRGRKRTPESIKRRLAAIDTRLSSADALTSLQLRQERRDLQNEMTRLPSPGPNIAELEREFVKVAKPYAARKGIAYDTWRQVGVPASVLRTAGITRSLNGNAPTG
jgi:hypothetical protein